MSDRDHVTCPDCLGTGKDPRGEQPWTKYDGDACIVCAGHGKVSPELAELVIRTREEDASWSISAILMDADNKAEAEVDTTGKNPDLMDYWI